MTEPMQQDERDALIARYRAALRALMAELLDETVAAGDLQRIVRSVRQSLWEDDEAWARPKGAFGALAEELARALISTEDPFVREGA